MLWATLALSLTGCGGPKYSEIPGYTAPSGTGGSVTMNTSTSSSASSGGSAADKQPLSSPRGPLDLISVGDTLTVTFTDLPGANQQQQIEERVREDGTITLIQNLSFKAAGKPRGQLEREIREAYVPKYFKTMTPTVIPKKDTQFYYVNGEVKMPNRQVYLSRLTVTKAIASANGFTDFARKSAIDLIRSDGRKETVNFFKAIKDPTLDPEIYPGDIIYVHRKKPWQS